MKNLIVFISVFILLMVTLIVFAVNGLMIELFVNIGVEVIIMIICYFYSKIKVCKYGIKLKLYELFKPNLEIRISASYLYRIEVNGKYLLIKNRKRKVYQPIGGVYKYFESAKSFLDEIEYKPDNKIEIDEINKNDLRIRIKAKYITRFLDWFYNGKDREIDYIREFQEETLKTNILSNNFNNINCKKVRTIRNTIKYSDFYDCYEILPKDIISIELNEAQTNELLTLYKKDSSDYVFASEEEINKKGISPDSQEVKFGDHTKYII